MIASRVPTSLVALLALVGCNGSTRSPASSDAGAGEASDAGANDGAPGEAGLL
jgi:hypothetical protein